MWCLICVVCRVVFVFLVRTVCCPLVVVLFVGCCVCCASSCVVCWLVSVVVGCLLFEDGYCLVCVACFALLFVVYCSVRAFLVSWLSVCVFVGCLLCVVCWLSFVVRCFWCSLFVVICLLDV